MFCKECGTEIVHSYTIKKVSKESNKANVFIK